MVVVKIFGGLGNQMFQYAVARSISINLQAKLILDTSYYQPNFEQNYGLSVFNINAEVVNSTPENNNKNSINLSHYQHNDRTKDYHHLKEKSFRFDSSLFNISGNIYLDGYFQSEKYFMTNRHNIYTDFSLREELDSTNRSIVSDMESCNSVSIHVRRGDYLIESIKNILSICDVKYYKKAVDIIYRDIKNPVFYVFSDDIDWAKRNLSFIQNTYFININFKEESYKDMILMSKCKHNIISNSTFSWWAAWLNDNPNKMIISPIMWFNPKSRNSKNDQDIRPASWIQV
jgi:hypothetical protein